ncbi:MAG: PilX N-terminal domain-containing pilus assembly protein [Woeseia sp.]
MRITEYKRNQQTGAALIVALIFLLLMTLLSTTSMRTSTMQERMAGNMRDWNLGFQGAEASIRAAEDWLLTTNNLPEFNDADGLYTINSTDRPTWTGDTISNGAGYIDYPDSVAGVAEQPRYFVERLDSIRPAGSSTETGTPVEEFFYFRITAVGYGGAEDDAGDPLSSVVLRTVYRSR